MSVFKFCSVALLGVGLSGCLASLEALTLPATTRTVSPALPNSYPDSHYSAPARLDFRILDARARIGGRDYVMDAADRPVVTALGGDTWRLDLTLRRSARSSLRGDEVLTTYFYYDGVELIFFGDRNGNQRLDRHEPRVRHVVGHTREWVSDGNKRWLQPRTLDVALGSQHVSGWSRVNTLSVRLLFVAAHVGANMGANMAPR